MRKVIRLVPPLTDTLSVLESIEKIKNPLLRQAAFAFYGRAIGRSASELKRMSALYQESR